MESVADEAAQQTALQNLLVANITVHVISYTQMQEQMAQKSTQKIRLGDGKTKPCVPDYFFDDILRGLDLSPKQKSWLKMMNEAQSIVAVSSDNEMIRAVRRECEAWRTSAAKLENYSRRHWRNVSSARRIRNAAETRRRNCQSD